MILGPKKLGTIGIIGGSTNPSKIKVFDYVGNFIDENAELALGQDRTNAGCAHLEQGPGGDPHILIGNFFLQKSQGHRIILIFNSSLNFQSEATELPAQNC